LKGEANKINHKQIVKMVCEKTGKPKNVVEEYINCYIDTIMDQMFSGHNVGIQHLGTMKVDDVAEKLAFDFKENGKVMRPKRKLPKMSFNREFSNKVRELNK
jgi:nucleoid DNA-binding protein